MIEKILEILFPTSCVICGKIYKKWICPKCYYKLKNELKFVNIEKRKFDMYFIGFYEGKIRELLLNFKFNEKPYISNFFAELIYDNKLFNKKIKTYDFFIPVPMHIKNKKERGYNQTELLGQSLQEKFNVPVLSKCLIKKKLNKKQSSLTGEERKENVKGVYEVQNKSEIYNKKILLIDDIYTTGNTINACMKELKKGKPKRIDILIIAKRN